MPSFDVSSEVNWHELDNAINQTRKEVTHRFDFKGVKSEIEFDQAQKILTLTCSLNEKLDSLVDVLQSKMVKRGLSLYSFKYDDPQPATGSSVRQTVRVQSGISKDDAKKLVKLIKEEKFKVQAQIQEDQLRVTAKSRDLLQSVIQFLKGQQDSLQISMQFGNFRE